MRPVGNQKETTTSRLEQLRRMLKALAHPGAQVLAKVFLLFPVFLLPACSAPGTATPTRTAAPATETTWLVTRSAIDQLQEAGFPQAQLNAWFDNPHTYLVGKVPPGWTSIATLSFASYAELARQFAAGQIPVSVRAIVYDNEHWSFTPAQEQQDFPSFAKEAASLVHLHHMILLSAPAVDLTQVLDPSFLGNRNDRFLALDLIGAAAAFSDGLDIQAQGSEADPVEYADFVASAVDQAKRANPTVVILSGLSTNPSGQQVTAGQLFAAYQATRSLVDGYWLNIPSSEGGYCPRCGPARPGVAIDFLREIHP